MLRGLGSEKQRELIESDDVKSRFTTGCLKNDGKNCGSQRKESENLEIF